MTAGPRRKGRSLSDHERKVTAVHELGHALVAHLLLEADPVQKVTIVSRGQMSGYTRMTPEEDRRMWSMPQFKAAMASALGGHVAEELAFGQVTAGPQTTCGRRLASPGDGLRLRHERSLAALAVGSEEDGRVLPRVRRAPGREDRPGAASAGGRGPSPGGGAVAATAGLAQEGVEELLEIETIDGKAMARLFDPRPYGDARAAAGSPAPGAARGSARSGDGLEAIQALTAAAGPGSAAVRLSFQWRRRRSKPTPPTLAEAWLTRAQFITPFPSFGGVTGRRGCARAGPRRLAPRRTPRRGRWRAASPERVDSEAVAVAEPG